MPSHLLLTGATGSIGRLLLPQLLSADSERRITVLVRQPQSVPKHPRITIIEGDLREPALAVDPHTWRSLASSLTGIVHCAADTRFTRTLTEARAVNAEGTIALLALARDCNRLERFAHISTAYIMGRDEGTLFEREYSNCSGFVNTYQQSKYEAERAVFAMPNIPAAVFRLSSVIGTQTNYLHRALRFIPNNPFHLLPGAPDCRMDFISESFAAAALSALFERHFKPGAVFHICAGEQNSIPVAKLLELACRRFGQTHQPVLVPLPDFERYAETIVQNGAREAIQELLRFALSFLPHMALHQTFETSATEKLLVHEGLSRPDSLTLLQDVLAHVATGQTLPPIAIPARQPIRRNAQPTEELQRDP